MQDFRAYVAAFFAFLVLDVLWLTVIAFEIFQSEVGGILRAEPNLLGSRSLLLTLHTRAAHSCDQTCRTTGLIGLSSLAGGSSWVDCVWHF